MIYLGCCWFYEFAFVQLVSIVVVFLEFNEQIYFFFFVCMCSFCSCFFVPELLSWRFYPVFFTHRISSISLDKEGSIL